MAGFPGCAILFFYLILNSLFLILLLFFSVLANIDTATANWKYFVKVN